MTRIRTRVATLAMIVAVPAALAGCFGSGGDSPQDILDETFNNDTAITSGNLNVSLGITAEGRQGGSFTASLEGPFQGDPENKAAFPQFALTGKVSGEGAGEKVDFSGGLTATADQAIVTYQGQNYEVPSDLYSAFKTAYEQQAQSATDTESSSTASASALLDELGIDPSNWITNLSDEGDADVEGADTVHLHGDANVSQILTDVVTIVQSTPGAGLPSGFDPSQLDLVGGFVKNAGVDVYSGKDDHILRKLELKLSIAPPGGAGGITSADVTFSLTLGGVNQEQTISAPSGPTRPIQDLLDKLGIDLGALGSIGNLGSGSVPGLPGGGSSGGPSAQELQDLQTCIAEAGSDPDKLNACFQQQG